MTVFGSRVSRQNVLACCSALALNGEALAAAAAVQTAPLPDSIPQEVITVIGKRLFNILPERQLDSLGIESYGQSTIDELISEIQGELGDDDVPLIIVNGERIGDLRDIGGLPVEALENVRILPRGTAVRVGGRAGQRVVDITLKNSNRTVTLLAAPKVATDGDWHGERGEAILNYLRGSTRANVTLKARHESDLLESDRGIEQPSSTLPYSLVGNVLGFPGTAGEIDPLLSAAVGEIVTVAAVPSSNPGFPDFVSSANEAAMTDIGEFRTLRPKTKNYDLNGTFTSKVAPWLTATIGVRLGQSSRRSLRGLPQALFILSPSNVSSPFSTTVALAQLGRTPLVTRSQRDSAEATLTLNGRIGSWTSFLNARHFRSTDETQSGRRASSGNVVLPDAVSAFETDLFEFVPIRTNLAAAKNRTTQAKLAFTGPLIALPAGNAQATFEGQFIANDLVSRSDFASFTQNRKFSRDESSLRAAIELPVTRQDGFGAAFGDFSATADFSRVQYSDVGSANNYQLGIAWEPRPVLRLSADIEKATTPPIVLFLGSPTIITTGVRTFDPLTGASVDVTQITGGNPDLSPEKTSTFRLSALVRPISSENLQLNVEYTDRAERNFVSSLPEASAAVTSAFPDRFVRDPDGTLNTVDLRPVNFDTHREKRFRYGASLSKTLGERGNSVRPRAPASFDSSEDGELPEETGASRNRAARAASLRAPPTRINLSASHSIVLKDEISIRPGLPTIDLLNGGAVGIGGGRLRHQLDATASITSGGTGLRVNALWRGRSTLNAVVADLPERLSFSPVFNLNLRAFADLHRFLPAMKWTRSTRVSLNVLNATNARQNVRDSEGTTPLRYQPAYRDALGRTVELEVRKVF